MLGVLAGNDMPIDQLRAWALSADVVAAADGGANSLAKVGISPHVVIGDFDSIDQTLLTPDCVFIEDQSLSDCDKLLAYLASSGATSVTLTSIEGDRLDHVLATLHSAARSALDIRLALRSGIGFVVRSGLSIPVPRRATVSLLPITDCTDVHFSGVKWQLSGADLRAGGSLSNVVEADSVEVKLGSGVALLVLTHPSFRQPTWPEAS